MRQLAGRAKEETMGPSIAPPCAGTVAPISRRAAAAIARAVRLAAAGCLSILVLAAMPILAAAGGQTLEEVKEKWIGKPLSALIDTHGYPDENFRAPNGHMVYVYAKNGEKLVTVPVIRQPELKEIELYETKSGAYSYGVQRQPGGIILEHHVAAKHCTGYFEINDQDTIIAVRFKGKDCPK
jgi:hypothetical protein